MPIVNSGIHMIKANNLCSHITIYIFLSWISVQKARKWKQFMLVFLKKNANNNQICLV